jgi:CRP/FNR family cyclic AMP-dependent transcriptional regulator
MPDVAALAGFRLFDRLSAAQLATVADTVREVSFDAGATLFEDGQQAVGCWLIRSGQVALETNFPGRGQVTVQTLGSGDVLGWSWLVPPHHWHFTAVVTAPVTAAELDPALGYPLALGLFEVLLARLQSTRARLLDMYGSPRDR